MDIWASAVLWDFRLKKTAKMQDLLGILRKYDISGLEVRPYWKDDPFIEAAELSEAAKREGIALSYACYESILGHSLMETERQLALLQKSMELASILGSKILRVNVDEHADWQLLQSSQWRGQMEKVLLFAEKSDISLVLENPPHRVNGSLENIKQILDVLPSLKLTFDTGNWMIAGEHPATALHLFAEEIGYLHLKDIRFMGSGGYDHCQPGLGGFEFPSFLKLIKQMGYSGPAVLEFGAGDEAEKHLQSALSYLQVTNDKE